MSKKSKILLTVLLSIDGPLYLFVPEVSKVAYFGIWLVAVIFWALVCRQDKTIRAMRRIERIDREIFSTELEIIGLLNSRIADQEAGCGIKECADKINAMTKVTSATGQTYVDFDDVMCILEGGDIVER